MLNSFLEGIYSPKSNVTYSIFFFLLDRSCYTGHLLCTPTGTGNIVVQGSFRFT